MKRTLTFALGLPLSLMLAPLTAAPVTATVALIVVLGMTSGARADEAAAKSLLKAMSDYMAAQNAISLSYDTNLEIVTKDKQKLTLASSGTITLNRPDKIRATRQGGFTDVAMVFDGKTLTLLKKNGNLYGQVDAPGTIDPYGQKIETVKKRGVVSASVALPGGLG
jgi:hypothetical protein